MKERQRHTFPKPVHMLPGDLLVCSVDDRETMQRYTYREEIGRDMTVDTLVTFELEEGDKQFGLCDGIGAIFGKAIEVGEPSPCVVEDLVLDERKLKPMMSQTK